MISLRTTGRMRLRAMSVLLAGLSLWVAGATSAAELPREQVEFFEKKIRPVLVERCYECHSAAAKKLKGGLALDTRAGMLKGGDTGPAVVPGAPDKSKLIEAVRYQNHDLQMPPKSPLRPEQVRDLEQWVKLGAPDPRTEPTQASARKGLSVEEGRKFWAFQPLLSEEAKIGRAHV